MSVVDFDYLPVTTMTVVIKLQGMVNILHAFPLLLITRMKIEESNRRRQKFKIPYPGFPGAILSATYGGFTRGIVRSVGPKYFRNSITIDVSTKEKNVNLKLSATGIQMCGPTSDEMALEAANHLINNIYQAQDMIDYIRSHPEASTNTLEWVKEHTKGDECLVVAGTDTLAGLGRVVYCDFSQTSPEKKKQQTSKPTIPIIANKNILGSNDAKNTVVDSPIDGGIAQIADDNDRSSGDEASHGSTEKILRSSHQEEKNPGPEIIGYIPPVFNQFDRKKIDIPGYQVQKVNHIVIPDE